MHLIIRKYIISLEILLSKVIKQTHVWCLIFLLKATNFQSLQQNKALLDDKLLKHSEHNTLFTLFPFSYILEKEQVQYRYALQTQKKKGILFKFHHSFEYPVWWSKLNHLTYLYQRNDKQNNTNKNLTRDVTVRPYLSLQFSNICIQTTFS